MIPATSPFEEATSREISALIAVLNESGQRLEELTAGEVDAVTDRKGQAFLLRKAQEHLRNLETVKQAAILNALPAHIALLDSSGVIVSVNDSWQRYARMSAPQNLVCSVGCNFLEACDAMSGEFPAGRQIASELLLLIAGKINHFSIVYAAHLPLLQRWFQLIATPLAESGRIGAIVMQVDVSAEKHVQNQLRESDRRLSDMLSDIDLVAIMTNLDGRLTHCNDYFLNLTGWRRDEVIGKNFIELFIAPDQVDDLQRFKLELMDNVPAARHRENEILTRSGDRRLIHWNNTVLRSSNGEVTGAASIGEDITERKRAALSIERLNRVHAVLSQANALAARVLSRDELFSETCRIAVEVGRFSMAWIGVVDPQTLDGKIVARCGSDRVEINAAALTMREGLTVSERPENQALRRQKPVICNDVSNDPCLECIRDELLANGHRSAAYFPLTLAGHTQAVIALFAPEPGAFDEAETKLLLLLAGDISFALNHLQKQERLDYLAYYDALTGLANRGLFLERLAQFQRSAIRDKHKLAVLLVDLERFNNINDGLGRTAGDTLLKLFAEWLTQNLGDASVLGRVGADQFAAVIPEVHQQGDVAQIVETMLSALLQQPFRLNDADFRISAKVGVAIFPDDASTADTVLRYAEAALKKATMRGDRYLFYTPDMTGKVAGKLTLETQLHEALHNREFVLHYQPKKSFISGELTGAEALIRWNDPRTGLVPPGRFIPVLEETGLIYDVGRWALGQAVADYLRWKRLGLNALRIAVNVSPLQVRHRGFVAEIRHAIAIDRDAAAGLELELTESLIMEDVSNSIESLKAIRAMGVQIAIDDFGTGFSSLSYLSRLPVDTLKIDRSFVLAMTTSSESIELVSTIINLAHSMRLIVVAEGVETDEQARLLRLLSCDEMQGFLLGQAVPSDVFESLYLAPE